MYKLKRIKVINEVSILLPGVAGRLSPERSTETPYWLSNLLLKLIQGPTDFMWLKFAIGLI